MEPVAHALVTYLLYQETTFALLAVIAGIFPDFISTIPGYLYHIITGKRTVKEIDNLSTLPKGLSAYCMFMYRVSHSLVIATVVWIGAAIVFGPQWWLLGWHLHIVIDIFMHTRRADMQFLWPLNAYSYDGISWKKKRTLLGTYVGIGAAYGVFWLL